MASIVERYWVLHWGNFRWNNWIEETSSMFILFELLQGLYIRYRDLSSSTHKYDSLTVMKPDSELHDVGNLEKFSKYEFFISPFYRWVEGAPSNSKIVQTLEDGEWKFFVIFSFSFLVELWVNLCILTLFVYLSFFVVQSSYSCSDKCSSGNAKFNIGCCTMESTTAWASQRHSFGL